MPCVHGIRVGAAVVMQHHNDNFAENITVAKHGVFKVADCTPGDCEGKFV